MSVRTRRGVPGSRHSLRRAVSHAVATTGAVIAVVLPLIAAAGCGDQRVDVRGVRVDTVGGVVRVHNEGSGAWKSGESWSLGPPVRIGSDPLAEDPYAFGSVTGVTVADDGRIYVADGQSLEVRVFDADGSFLFRFGRSGRGPGEFGAIDGLATAPDGTLFARDPGVFRVTRFDAEGEYLSDFRLQRPYPQYSGGVNFAVDDAGRIWDRVSLSMGVDSDDSLAVVGYDPSGATADTIIAAVQPRRLVNVVAGGVPRGGMPVPFAPQATAAVAANGAIARTLGAEYSIDVLSSDGSVLRTFMRDQPPLPVTADERDAALAFMQQTALELFESARLDDFEFPSAKPAITHLLADAAGNWWVGASGSSDRLAGPAWFDVFNAAGVHLGRIDVKGRIAGHFRPIEIGTGHLAAVAVDSLGIESVAVLPLVKPEADRRSH